MRPRMHHADLVMMQNANRLRGLALVMLLAACGTAVAQTPPAAPPAPPAASAPPPSSEAVKSIVGPWEISNADRDKLCAVTFRADTALPGFKLEFDKACIAAFPMIRD